MCEKSIMNMLKMPMILGSTLFAKYQKMTGCLFIFFRSQTVDRWLLLLQNPKMSGACHFIEIQK